MSNEEFHIRVTLDGKFPKFELMRGNVKQGDMSFIDVVNLGTNCISVLRWVDHPFEPANRL